MSTRVESATSCGNDQKSKTMDDDIAETMYHALDMMLNQSPEHRGPYAPNDRDLKAAKEWLFENTDV